MGCAGKSQRAERLCVARRDYRYGDNKPLEPWNSPVPSVWIRWRLSPFEYSEITINNVFDEVNRALDEPPVEALGELHTGKTYIVNTNGGAYVLCRRRCKKLGLPIPKVSGISRFRTCGGYLTAQSCG